MANVRGHTAKIWHFLAASCFVSGGWAAASADHPNGINCQLRSPPMSAGEIASSDQPWRVYPRTRNISPKYSGCQTVWAPKREENGWDVVFITVVKNGQPVRHWPAPPSPVIPTLVGSVAPGCLAKSLLKPKPPPGCEADAENE